MNYPIIDLKATGARIRELRIKNNLTDEEVMAFMGFEAPQAVYKSQRGESLPSVDNLFALSKLFGARIEDILVSEERNMDNRDLDER